MTIRLRTRIMIIIGVSMGLLASVLVFALYSRMNALQLDDIRYQVRRIAERASARIDGDVHAKLTNPEFLAKNPRASELAGNADYQSVMDGLWKTYRENHDKRTRIVNIYTMAPAPEGGWMYVADADLDSDLSVCDPGRRYLQGSCPDDVLEHPTADADFVTDEDGTWLTGYAPIRDRQGRAVGFVGVDLAKVDVLERLRPLGQWFIMAGAVALLAAWLSGWLLSRWLSRPIEALHAGTQEIRRGNLAARVPDAGSDEFGELSRAFNQMIEALRDREHARDTLRRYVPAKVADRLLARENVAGLMAGERVRVTVLFCDLRGFTALAETRPPAEVFALLNRMFASVSRCIERHGGMLDKFIGDNVMAVFGAPAAQGDDAARAVACALDIQKAIAALNSSAARDGHAALSMGIGIHSGVVVAGEVGTAERSEYTVIGHHVNLAKRIEEAAGGGEVVVSEAVWHEAEDLFTGSPAGELTTSGGKTLSLYRINSLRAGATAPGCPAFEPEMPDVPEAPESDRLRLRPSLRNRPSTRSFPVDTPPSRN